MMRAPFERGPSELSGLSPCSGRLVPGIRQVPETVPTFCGERGAGRLKALVWTLIFVVFVVVSARVIPIYVNEYEFVDGMQTIARFATVNRQGPDQIRDAVMKEADKDGLTIRKEDVHVGASAGNVNINVDYSVTVDLRVYQWTLNFHPSASNNALF
jgi:uncharacterized protein DUF4845